MVTSKTAQSLLLSTTCFLTILGISILGTRSVNADESAIKDETCLACHDDRETSGPHQLASMGGDAVRGVQCVSCHAGAEGHVDDPEPGNISNPAKLTGLAARQACLKCHQPHLELDAFGFNPHNEQEVNCASCHKVHADNSDLLLSDNADFCLRCHSSVETAFSQLSQHPLKQGNITCLSCHRFARQADHNTRWEQVRVCQDCHPQQAGPFPYEHPATQAHLIEGGGCMECHQPHGSENDRLLRQPGEGLCLQCHLTPPGHLDLPALHGPVRDIDNCVACHSDIHGSFVSSHFLDPMLQIRLGSSQPCADCHDLTR